MTLLRDHSRVFLGIALLGCASNRTVPAPTLPTPVPAPSSASPTLPNSRPSTWSFTYAPGTANYTVTRKATIESVDSVRERKISTNLTHEIITLQPRDSVIDAVAVVDTFTITMDNGSPTSLIQAPIQASASLRSKALAVNDSSDSCSQAKSVVTTDLYNVLVPFPSPLTIGAVWKDTVNVKGCQAGVTMTSNVTRSFVVTGEVPGDTRPLVAVTRIDSAEFQGEGGLEQHRVSIHANGTGTALYYLNTETGQVIHLSVNQILTFDITTQEKRQQLRQETVEDFEIIPP